MTSSTSPLLSRIQQLHATLHDCMSRPFDIFEYQRLVETFTLLQLEVFDYGLYHSELRDVELLLSAWGDKRLREIFAKHGA